jgi:hypothetical protein
MADVVEWKTAKEIIEYLMQQNELVSGMSVAEAAAALGFTKTASGIYVKTVITTTAESVVGTTAASVAPAASTSATSTATNLVLFQGASGTAEVGGLGSVALPIASCMLAAAGGYMIGNEVYKQNSEFLDKLMFPLYDFITGNNIAETLYEDDVPTMPIIFNASGEVFMDSRAYNELIDFLDKCKDGRQYTTINGISTEYGVRFPLSAVRLPAINNTLIKISSNIWIKINNISHPEIPIYLFFARGYKTINPGEISECYQIVLASKESWSGDLNNDERIYHEEYNGKPVIYIGYAGGIVEGYNDEFETWLPNNTLQLYSLDGCDYDVSFREIAYAILYGDSPIIEEYNLPDGITTYTPATSTVQPITFPDEIPEWIPVSVPATVPGVMPEPVEYPDPNPNPEKINPFINPIQPQPDMVPIKTPSRPSPFPIVPVPHGFPNQSTEPYPRPNPNIDPSQLVGPLPSLEQVPMPEPDIIDTGETPIPILPEIPSISSSATGLLHVYNPTTTQINEFGAWLWTTFSGDLIETLSKLFNNPMDAVIGLHELYATPITSSDNTTIKAGYLDSQVASRLVSERYCQINCGAVSVPEFWGNYLDYAPYTKTFCYLPFIGMVELNTDDIVGSGVEISYKIDSYNGSCIALITTAKSGSTSCVTYQYSGNCAVEIPITSGMKSAMQSALIGAATTALVAATGGSGAMLGAALIGGVRGASTKNLVQHSGTFGSSYGAMGLKKPYIIVKRPKQKVVAGYNDNYGYPSHKMIRIADCTGYLKAIEVDVVSPTATENEKKMIEKLLKDGVFVS